MYKELFQLKILKLLRILQFQCKVGETTMVIRNHIPPTHITR